MYRAKYLTKFSNLTHKLGLEPEDYLKSRLALDVHAMKLYVELEKVAKLYSLPMISKRTLYSWIDKIKQSTTNR